jgi:membrane protease subunit (stomatin/prohibitin family)
MSLRDFLSQQFIDVIDWVEPADGILAYRYPMQDREIQMAAYVADPDLPPRTGTKPSPFKSDVYFFSTRIQTNQHWGDAQPHHDS